MKYSVTVNGKPARETNGELVDEATMKVAVIDTFLSVSPARMWLTNDVEANPRVFQIQTLGDPVQIWLIVEVTAHNE